MNLPECWISPVDDAGSLIGRWHHGLVTEPHPGCFEIVPVCGAQLTPGQRAVRKTPPAARLICKNCIKKEARRKEWP